MLEAALPADVEGLPISVWITDDKNIAIKNDLGDVSLFEYRKKGVYMGHYFFHSRGVRAVVTARAMLRHVMEEYPTSIILGTTPLHKKGALRLSAHLGFTHMSDDLIAGVPHRIWSLTKKDYNEMTRINE